MRLVPLLLSITSVTCLRQPSRVAHRRPSVKIVARSNVVDAVEPVEPRIRVGTKPVLVVEGDTLETRPTHIAYVVALWLSSAAALTPVTRVLLNSMTSAEAALPFLATG